MTIVFYTKPLQNCDVKVLKAVNKLVSYIYRSQISQDIEVHNLLSSQ